MELQVYKIDGELAGRSIEVADEIFAATPHEHAVYQAIQAQLTNARQGNAATKTRTMVSGGGRKPWKQKGRGTARAGTTRSPIWRGGGIIHGPQPHSFSYDLPKKVKRLARISALASKAGNDQLKVLEDFSIPEAKTRHVSKIMIDMGLDKGRTLMLISEYNSELLLASRNIKNFKVQVATNASTYDIMNCETLLVAESAVKKLEGSLLS
ncbi:50S ribosomal protein L4 [candidate division KSB1 bacterium]|jgi:large subunit ribosomal protein L4|nr:50S ribosomal protein L4 [candidate division KSB1 bacterium]